ncbi:hypothetical protein M569_07086, partial [Genlisea aurea]
ESWPYEAIPVDLFVTKRLGFHGGLRFTDSNGNLVYYTVKKSVGKTDDYFKRKLLLDSSGNELVSLDRKGGGSWRGECKTDEQQQQPIFFFTTERTANEFNRSEFKIIVKDSNREEMSEFEMRGSPLKRACTIYKHDSIVAETSLMYRIGVGKLFVPRSRFRVTLFPGFHQSLSSSLVAAFVVLYFDGRKLWI